MYLTAGKLENNFMTAASANSEVKPVPGIRSQSDVVPIFTEWDNSVQASILEIRIKGYAFFHHSFVYHRFGSRASTEGTGAKRLWGSF